MSHWFDLILYDGRDVLKTRGPKSYYVVLSRTENEVVSSKSATEKM